MQDKILTVIFGLSFFAMLACMVVAVNMPDVPSTVVAVGGMVVSGSIAIDTSHRIKPDDDDD